MQKKPSFRMSFDECLKRETAKMSWLGHMSPILERRTKESIEDWFAAHLDLAALSNERMRGIDDFETWHNRTTRRLAKSLHSESNVKKGTRRQRYSAFAVAAKLVDTFSHQLTKYPPFSHLYEYLHLPLDQVVRPKILARAKKLQVKNKEALLQALDKNAYTLKPDEYETIQNFLPEVVKRELSNRIRQLYGCSRILLNPHLWATK